MLRRAFFIRLTLTVVRRGASGDVLPEANGGRGWRVDRGAADRSGDLAAGHLIVTGAKGVARTMGSANSSSAR